MSNNSSNRNRNNQNRRSNPNKVAPGTTAKRAAEANAKAPVDKVTTEQVKEVRQQAAKAAKEVDYLKNPEKFPNWELMLPVDQITSYEDETLLKFRLGMVTSRFTKFMIYVYDTNGEQVELWDDEGTFIDPLDEDGNTIPLFDEEGNPVDLDDKLEEMRLLAIDEAKADPEIAVINLGKLVDIMCDKFAADPVALRRLARREGFEPIIQLATLYAAILGEFERSEG